MRKLVVSEWMTLDGVVQAPISPAEDYEYFPVFWPHAPESERAVAEPLNTRPKYVVSTTLSEPLAWQHATLLAGDVARAVEALKAQPGGDLLLLGSPRLAQLLLARDLVDEIRLTIDPVMTGSGKRLFGDDGQMHALRLVDQQVTRTGAILAHFARR